MITCLHKYRRVGIFGGTFDPVHIGHIKLAELVLSKALVDKIIFVPTFEPPHKEKPLASFSHRLAMLELAIKGNESFAVSGLEAKLDTPSYSINTFIWLNSKFPETEFFFLMGADSLRDFPCWKDCHKILMLTNLVVASRTITPDAVISSLIGVLPGFVKSKAVSFANGIDLWQGEGGKKVYYLSGLKESVSSSEVRSSLLTDKESNMLSREVFSYIRSRELYGLKA